MFVQLQPDLWLNTDHIITIDLRNFKLETTPGMMRKIEPDSVLVTALLEYLSKASRSQA